MDNYIRTSERFRVIRVFFGVPESYENSYWALMGHTGKERKTPKGGRTPCPIRTRGRGGARPFLAAPLSSHQGPCGPLTLRGGSGNPPALRFSPKSPGTLPVSEYSRPIYQSLCLDHFETPCHVPDLIRDSELLRYIKTHKLII